MMTSYRRFMVCGLGLAAWLLVHHRRYICA